MSTHYHIGEFAELCGVSAKTFVFMRRSEWLRPASVDPRTGYRRYLPQQLEQMASILALKNLGVPLAQVSEFRSASQPKSSHGLGKSSSASKIQISATRVNDMLETKVQDDGPGFPDGNPNANPNRRS
jgi:DNA-binding transcriptional MerR regulator